MNENIVPNKGRGVSITSMLSVASSVFSIGNGIYDFYNSHRSADTRERKGQELLKWQNRTSEQLDNIEKSLIVIGDSLKELSKLIVETVQGEFENYVKNVLMADIRTITAQYVEWNEVIEGNDDKKKSIVVRTIVDKKQELFKDSAVAFGYGYYCCDSLALALTTLVSLCDLIDNRTGLNGIFKEFESYFNACLESIDKELSNLKGRSDEDFWHSTALVQAKTNIEKYLVSIENIKNPGIQISVNRGIVRIGESDDPNCPFSNLYGSNFHYRMLGSKVEVNVLGNDLGGEIVTANVKLIKVIAIDPDNSNSIFYDKTFYEDLGWEELCNTALARVENIDFTGKLVLVIISGAYAFQYPTASFAKWLRSIGAKLEDWKVQTNASGPTLAICYFYLGETKIPKAEKFMINLPVVDPGLERYMVRINYNYGLH